jgi:hypothetical protein
MSESNSLHFHTSSHPSVKTLIGRLPKHDFPKFDRDNPKLCQSSYKSYFDMYSVESSVWVKVATMHFEGAAVTSLRFKHIFCALIIVVNLRIESKISNFIEFKSNSKSMTVFCIFNSKYFATQSKYSSLKLCQIP